MNFGLVRAGWPNTAAIAALAILPIMSLMALPQQNAAAETIESATVCQSAGATVLATLLPGGSLE